MGIYARHDSKWHRVDGSGSTSVGTQWGDFTTNGDASEEDTWTAPDSQGRIWKYAVYDAAGDYTIELTGGMYWVLCVGGGSGGTGSTGQENQGQPGLVNEGYWEFAANKATPIKVGRKGPYTAPGRPSSIGNYGTQGHSRWGSAKDGRGGLGTTLSDTDDTGYKSGITGNPNRQFATGRTGEDEPGRSGNQSNRTERDGCVIIATVDEEKTDYYPPGALPGIGGWATITDVKGKGKKYAYGDWVAYEWTANGEVTTQAGGLVDVLAVGAGGGGTGGYFGGGGGVSTAVMRAETTDNFIRVAPATTAAGDTSLGRPSSFNSLVALGGTSVNNFVGYNPWVASTSVNAGRPTPGQGNLHNDTRAGGAGGPGTASESGPGIVLNYTGNNVEYGAGGKSSAAPANTGQGGPNTGGPGAGGTVIVRVPKDQDHFTDITGSEAGEPFDIPTTRQTIVEALEEKVEEAKEAVRDRRKRR